VTEAEWLAATDPEWMLEFLRGKASDRKLRLFAVACCRHLLEQVTVNPWDEDAVNVAERFADGLASPDELQAAVEATTSDWTPAYACTAAASPAGGVDAAFFAADNAAHAAGEHAAFLVEESSEGLPAFTAGQAAEIAVQVSLLRDTFGNPFQPVTIDPSWRAWNGGTAVNLAAAIYADRAFDRLPLLADALEDAGCADPAILGHCRGGGKHVRGCWVVDLLREQG
jgi:hypothetical protein